MFPPQNGSGGGAPSSSVVSKLAVGARVPAVLKAFKLLDVVSSSDQPLGVSELARRLGLGKSTVHGLVTTLESLGVLRAVNGSRRYALGPRLTALCSGSGARADLRQAAHAALERLAQTTEQTSFLGVPSDESVTILDIVHGRPALSISAPVGSSIPMLAGAVGKVIVASWEADRRAAFLRTSELPAFTSASIVTPDGYERAVSETIARGAAIDADEYLDGVRAAAAAITGSQCKLVAVLWVAGFSRHIDAKRLEFIASSVKREAAAVSASLA